MKGGSGGKHGEGRAEIDADVLQTFRAYFAAFMHDSIEELARHVALPYFDLRAGELTELRSEPQLEGFRRGLRARMASLGIVGGTLEECRVLMADPSSALLQFESARNSVAGEVAARTRCLAFLRTVGGSWRVWMITVVQVLGAARNE